MCPSTFWGEIWGWGGEIRLWDLLVWSRIQQMVKRLRFSMRWRIFPNVDWWLFRKFSSDSAVIQQWFSSQVRSWINYVPFGRVGVLLGSSLGQINLEFMTQWATQGWRTIRGWLYLYFGEIYYSFSTNSLFCWSFESIYQDAARPLRLCLWYHLARSTGLGQLVTSHAPVHPHIRSCPPKLPEALFFPIEIR